MDIISYALSKKGMQQSVSDYLDEHLTNPTNPPLDTSLTIANAAADSKATGDKLSELKEGLSAMSTATSSDVGKALKAKTVTDGKVTAWEFGEAGGGISMTAVNLLNTILSEAVYGTDQTANIALLKKELSNVAPVSISAVLDGTALAGQSYSELSFVVTATFDDESTAVVDNYTVVTTGTVTTGSNTVTIKYRGVTTTCTFAAEDVTTYSITYNLTDVTSSSDTTVVVENSYYSTTLSVGDDYAFDGCTVTMGGVDITATAYSNMEILITAVTGNVVITASATEITYLTGFRRTSSGKNSVSYGYSDYFTTQNYRLNYTGISYVSEYPAKYNCTLNWRITNNTESSVLITAMAIGCIPINDDSYNVDANFRMAYCQPITNASNTLDAGESISGTYELRAGYQLAYVAQESQISALDIAFSGNYVADNFNDYEHLEFTANTSYGSYREIKWYSDNNETLLCSVKNNNLAIIENSIIQGRYDAICALRIADPTTISGNKNLAVGAVADNTVTEVPYSVGAHITNSAMYNIWHKGTIVVSGNGMTLIAPPLSANTVVIDFYIKGVTA